MFGQNQILKVVHDESGSLDVHSLFYTIQGEGPFAGRPSVFVRLHGCSLACSWCDTEFERERKRYSPESLLDAVRRCYRNFAVQLRHSSPLIVITGGEPMRQNLHPFISLARKGGYEVQIETAGIHWDNSLAQFFHGLSIVVSPKTPFVHQALDQCAVAIKYILAHDEPTEPLDGLPKYAVSQRGEPNNNKLWRPVLRPAGSYPERIYIQPRDDGDEARNRKNVDCAKELALSRGYRLSLQLHKMLSLP